MKSIEEIDKNFKIKSDISHEGVKFYDAEEAPLGLYGVFREGEEECFRRLPKAVAAAVNEGVDSLSTNTAGGRVRFRTDSPYVVLYAEMGWYGRMPHFAFSGSAGFDIYDETAGVHTYLGTAQPPMEDEPIFERRFEFGKRKMRDIIINMPTYSNVNKVYVGIDENAVAEPPKPYRYDLPVVYYGSSITQGGCSSRPGNTYQSIISRRLGCDFVNLGFSGSAMGEREIAEYIAGLSMLVFVYDYDHNAPDAEHLQRTHKPMFDVIREKNPNLPIVIVSRPNYVLGDSDGRRLEVVRKTYEAARSAGDKNVWFVSGRDIEDSVDPDIMTVDGCHPNDFGFWCMAECIGAVIEEALKR